MKFQLYFWALLFIFGMQPSLQAGEIYHWIDKDGVQHFTNLPPPPGAQIVEGLSETQSDEPSAGTRPIIPKDKRATQGETKGPTDSGDTGAVEGGKTGSTDDGDPSAAESGDRRFRKWNNSPTDREDSGATGFGKIRPYDDRKESSTIIEGEDAPASREDPGAIENEENRPSDRRLN